LFVTIRNIFRFAEFVQGAVLPWPVTNQNTYVLSEKQVLFYTLDTLPILIVFVVFIVYNPANFLPKYLVDPKTGERLPAGDVEGGGNSGTKEV